MTDENPKKVEESTTGIPQEGYENVSGMAHAKTPDTSKIGKIATSAEPSTSDARDADGADDADAEPAPVHEGKRLKTAIKSRRIRTEEFAEAIGSDVSTIYSWWKAELISDKAWKKLQPGFQKFKIPKEEIRPAKFQDIEGEIYPLDGLQKVMELHIPETDKAEIVRIMVSMLECDDTERSRWHMAASMTLRILNLGRE